MPKYTYVDESGTMDNQQIMTVALIVLSGSNSAKKILKTILGVIHSEHRKKNMPDLHYMDMAQKHRLAMAVVLAGYSIDWFASCFYHDGSDKAHKKRFDIYIQLLKICLEHALHYYRDMVITIAQQGGWIDYKPHLIEELQQIAVGFHKRGEFRKAKFQFKSSNNAGIQLADFYAGAIRGFLLEHADNKLGEPYKFIQGQVREIIVASYNK